MADLKTTNIYGDAYINNKVGIATNAPATRLQIGQLSPTAATEGIQFGDDTGARLHRINSGHIRATGGISSATFIIADNYLQTNNNLIYPASQTATQRLEVGNASGNAWVTGIAIAQGGNVTVYNNLTVNNGATVTNDLTVNGNTYLGNANNDTVYVNDTIRIGATDSGDASLFFGEGSVAGSDYGARWYWDSGYTFTWYTRNAGTDTALFDYVTNDTTYLNWRRHFHMQNKEINYSSQVHFNAGTRFVGNNTEYLVFRSDSNSVGGIQVQSGNTTLKGYIGYWDSGGGGILNNTGNWAVRYNFGSANSGGTLYGAWVVNGNISATNLSGTNTGDQTVGNGTITIAAGSGIGVGTSNTFTTNQTGATTVTISNNGVTSLTTNTGLSSNVTATGAVTVTNTGVTSNVAGTGISLSGGTGAVTITNSGVTSLAGTTNRITVSGATGAVTLNLPQDIHTGASPTFATITGTGEVVWSGYNSGNARAVRIGYSGGNYGGISYGINYTATSNSHTYAFNDAVTRIDLADGIQVYSAAGAAANTPVTWSTLLVGSRGNTYLQWKGNNVIDTSYSGTVSGLSIGGNAATATTLQTGRAINGVSFNGSAAITVNGLNYNVNNDWLRENGDDDQFKLYGNSRTMIYRTDGNTNAHGGGGYAHIFYYGGSADANRMFIINTDGRLWSNYHGWLDAMSITGNATTAGGLAVHGGRNNEANKIVRTDSNGYIQAGWINTPSGDMADTQSINKIYCSDDDYVRYKGVADFKQQIGLTYKNATPRSSNTTDSNYWTGIMGWTATDWNSMSDWGCGFVDSWDSPANRPPVGTHHVGIQSIHYTNGTARYGWQMANGGGNNRWWLRDSWGSSFSTWFEILTSTNYTSFAPSLTGTGASGNWAINVTGNAATVTNGIYTTNYWTGTPLGKRRNRIHSADSTSLNSSITNLECGFTYGGSGEPTGPFIAFGGLGGSIDYSCQLVGAYSGGGNDFKIRTRNDDTATWNTWRTIITDGNYSSYSPGLTGANASGTWSINITGNAATATSADNIDGRPFVNTNSNSGTNADSINSNGISYYTGGVTNFSGNATDGGLYSQAYSNDWQHQIAGDYRSGQIALRGKNSGTWQSWRRVLDDTNSPYALNMNQYVRTTDTCSFAGLTVSNTINGSVSGNAATATTATTATSAGSITSDTGNVGENRLQYWQVSGNTTLNPDGEWYNAIRMGHGNPVTYYGNTLAIRMTGGNLGDIYTRTLTNGTQGSWNRFWHNNNDGAGSGLDADLVDGKGLAIAATADTIVLRDASGHITGQYILGSYFNASAGNGENPTIGQIWTQNTTDNYLRKSTPAHFRSQVTDGSYPSLTGANASGTWSISVTGNAGTATSAVTAGSCTGNAATATLATKASTLSQGGGNGTGMTFNWSGQGGQPTWLWGSNDGTNIYVWNPSNFNVNYATSAGSATSATTAGSCSGNAATATNVAASGITGQTGMWTSATRPGPYRLYRNDDNSAYNVQLTWQAHRTNYWSLRGYLNDTFHAECFVVYSGYADSAGSAGALTTGNTYQVASLGIGVAASNKLHISGDGTNPPIRIDNPALGSGTSSSRGFYGWLPISIGGVGTKYIQLYN